MPVNGNAPRLHATDDIDQRPLQPLVDDVHFFGGQAGLQNVPKAQSHIRILRRIGGGLVDLHFGKGNE